VGSIPCVQDRIRTHAACELAQGRETGISVVTNCLLRISVETNSALQRADPIQEEIIRTRARQQDRLNGSLVTSKYKLPKSNHQDPLTFSKGLAHFPLGTRSLCHSKELVFVHHDYNKRVTHKGKRIDYVYEV